MRMHDYMLLALAALLAAGVFTSSPHAPATAQAGASGSIRWDPVHLSGFGRNAGYLADEDLPH